MLSSWKYGGERYLILEGLLLSRSVGASKVKRGVEGGVVQIEIYLRHIYFRAASEEVDGIDSLRPL